MDYRNQQNAAASLGYAQQVGSDACSPCSEMDTVRNRISEVLNFASMQGDRIEDIEVKLNGGGTISGASAQTNPRPAPNGTLGQMNQLLDDIMARLQRTDAAVSRLRSTI